MARHLYPRFLSDPGQYAFAERYWHEQWNSLPQFEKDELGWRAPWLAHANDGNPIFSAFSDTEKKGIRIIQYEPTSDDVEIDWWLDRFGGELTNPSAIRELVISCALSIESARLALQLLSTWLIGDLVVRTNHRRSFGHLTVGPTFRTIISPPYYAQGTGFEAA